MAEIIGTAGSEVLNGGAGDDIILGLAGDDTLNGGGGNDEMLGGVGDDVIFGGAGVDVLDGGVGADEMTGGAGDDVYVVEDTKDLVIEAANQGFDTVLSRINHTLAANVEELILLGAADLSGGGNALDNNLIGNAGKNQLDGGDGNDHLFGADGDDLLIGGAGDDEHDGGSGADTMQGGLGNDSYVVRSADDRVVEAAGQGTDLIAGFVDIDLSKFANVENVLLAAGAVAATGNEIDNRLVGNIVANALDGGAGNDNLFGVAGNDTLVGGLGNDQLDGGAGIDQMSGGAGDDTYVLDDAGDTVIEIAGEGVDTVGSLVDYTLGANIENLTLAGSAAIDGVGNDLANLVIGNGNGNVLLGNAGNDTLRGGGGGDTLSGGIGADQMLGEAGDDKYIVDNVGDTVTEGANQGVDAVQSSVTFTLGANVEHLFLTGKGDINGAGNTLDNDILGNVGNNRLIGGDGGDVLDGDFGNDTIDGGTGNDIIEGDRGADVMTGGAGADTFLYRIGALAEIGLIGGDTISRFQHGVDKIDLSDILSDFGIGANDAFTGGFLKIDVVGNNTQILFDQNGGGNDFTTLATLTNVKNVTVDDLAIL
jgi:Ca2+-binding RTX toxin-like protein